MAYENLKKKRGLDPSMDDGEFLRQLRDSDPRFQSMDPRAFARAVNKAEMSGAEAEVTPGLAPTPRPQTPPESLETATGTAAGSALAGLGLPGGPALGQAAGRFAANLGFEQAKDIAATAKTAALSGGPLGTGAVNVAAYTTPEEKRRTIATGVGTAAGFGAPALLGRSAYMAARPALTGALSGAGAGGLESAVRAEGDLPSTAGGAALGALTGGIAGKFVKPSVRPPVGQEVAESFPARVEPLSPGGLALPPEPPNRIVGRAAADLPTTGPLATRALTATEDIPARTGFDRLNEAVGNAYLGLRKLVSSEPELSPRISALERMRRGGPTESAAQEHLIYARQLENAADDVAAMRTAKTLEPLRNDPESLDLFSRYMTAADELQTLQDKNPQLVKATSLFGQQEPVGTGGLPISEIEKNVKLLETLIQDNPKVAQAVQAARSEMDNLFQERIANREASIFEAVDDGFVPRLKDPRAVPTGQQGQYEMGQYQAYRPNYWPRIPLEKTPSLLETARGTMAKMGITDPRMKARAAQSQALRETNPLKVMMRVFGEQERRMGQQNLYRALSEDPQTNYALSHTFEVGKPLPPGLAEFVPKQGSIGGDAATAAAQLLASGKVSGPVGYKGGAVFDERLANVLNNWRAHEQGFGGGLGKIASVVTEMWTSLSLPVTAVNIGSDVSIGSLQGLPGRRARPLEFARGYREAIPQVIKYLKTGEMTPIVERARREGLFGSTFMSEVGLRPEFPEFRGLQSSTRQPSRFAKTRNLLRSIRFGHEGSAKIAGGLSEERATGQQSQFAYGGLRSTLPFGAAAPDVTKHPAARWMAPFWQVYALESKRIADNLMTKGSRGRTVAGLVAPWVALALWNRHNEEFRKASDLIPRHLRSRGYVIPPDPMNWSKPWIDEMNRPVVFWVPYWFPAEIMRMSGFGNPVERAQRVVEGKDSPSEMIEDTGMALGQTLGMQQGPLGAAQDVMMGRSRLTGEPMYSQYRGTTGFAPGVVSAVGGLTPQTRGIGQLVERGLEGSPVRGVGEFLPGFAGLYRQKTSPPPNVKSIPSRYMPEVMEKNRSLYERYWQIEDLQKQQRQEKKQGNTLKEKRLGALVKEAEANYYRELSAIVGEKIEPTEEGEGTSSRYQRRAPSR